MNRCRKECLLERAGFCCVNLAFMVELSQRRPMPPKYLARLNREIFQEIQTLETVLEALRDDLAREQVCGIAKAGAGDKLSAA